MGGRKRKQDLSPKMDFDDPVNNSKKNSNQNKQNPQKSSKKVTESPKVIESTSKTQAKPVFVQASLKEVRKIISQTKLQVIPAFKISSPNSTQVFFTNIEDKASMIQGLKSQAVQFHTFSEKSERPKSFVLKGFYEAPTNEVLRLLQKVKIPAVKVTILVKKPEFTFYLVHFQDESVNINVLNHNFRNIDNIIVKWENIKKANKRPTQCFNCQRWGHSSQNCGYKFRCVKCTEVHAPGQCKRTSREGDAKCINCSGNHAASYRLCPSFVSYAKRIENSKTKVQHIKMQPQVPSSLASNNFPPLVNLHQAAQSHPKVIASKSSKHQEETNQQQLINNISYAEKLNEAIQNESLFKRFSEAQERLKKIPNIKEAIDHYCKFIDEVEKLPVDAPIGSSFNLLVKYGLIKDPTAPYSI